MRVEQSRRDFETANRVRRTVAESARLPAALTVEAAVSGVMCVLSERLTAGEATDLFSSIPPAIAPMFELCTLHRKFMPTSKIDRAEFLTKVADHLGVTPAHAELVSSAVFTAIRAELPADVVMSVAAQLPHGIKELWLEPPTSAPDLDVEIPPEETRHAMENDLTRRAKLPPHVTPDAAFAAVMCCFARRLSGGETRHLVLGLPASLRAIIERCSVHRERPAIFGRDELIREVSDHLIITDPDDTERILLEVLRSAKRVLPQKTIAEIGSQLPADLRELWTKALPPHET